jgi:hypothetical protein
MRRKIAEGENETPPREMGTVTSEEKSMRGTQGVNLPSTLHSNASG